LRPRGERQRGCETDEESELAPLQFSQAHSTSEK
jgi:hypothetical protein